MEKREVRGMTINAEELIEQIKERMEFHREDIERSDDEIFVLERIHRLGECKKIIEIIEEMKK